MADDTKSSNDKDIPKRAPGVLVGVEWTKKGTVDLSKDEQNAVKDLLTKLNQRDSPARREQIIRVWEKRLFKRGFQHIITQRGGGWALPKQGTGYGYGEEQSKSMYETNIYSSYADIIESAMTREVPTVRFKSQKPDDDAGITAAQSAESLKTKIVRDNNMLGLLQDVSSFLWTDGMAVFHTSYVKDAQQFGFAPDPEEAVPENEEKISEADESEEEHGGEAADSESGNSGVSEDEVSTEKSSESERDEKDEEGGDQALEKEPNGREVICVGGALEWKFPIRMNFLHECGYAIHSKEIDVHSARAAFPDVADEIQQANGGPGGDDLDRLARINVSQGMMDSYNTQDSQANDVTRQRAWLRPWQLLELGDKCRDSIISKFPEGMYVTFCGNTFCEARDASMDDCLSLLHARSGDGMNRPGLGDWLMPIQKVLNNWLELANDYFVRGVPAKWMDNEMFDVEALKDQMNMVGDVHPFQREQGVQMSEVIFEETAVVFPDQLMAFIQDFKGDLAQLLCGAFPALYGGDTQSNDTMGGITIQRDQALGRIGLPWRRLKEALAITMLQAVQCLAQNHDEPINVMGKVSVTVEMQDLKGDMFAFPDVDENFPETQTQKGNRLEALIDKAATNPMLAQLMDDPDNLELLKDAVGLENFVMPVLESRDKQLGEIEIMLHEPPIPNPAIQQLKKQIEKLTMTSAPLAATNPEAAQQAQTQIQTLQQQLQQLEQTAPLISSIDIDDRCDDNETEAMTALRFINSPRGRAMKNGNDNERASFTNIRLHYIAHDDAAKKKAAENAPPPIQKPPSISGNIKDMTPDEQSQALSQAGIKSDPANIAATRAATEAAKHPKEAVPVVQ
jgi:hypothetical protein